jgi:hypothetical protein
MTTAARAARVAPRPVARPSSRPSLRLLPSRTPGRPLVPYIVLLLGLLLCGLVGLLLLNTWSSQDAFRLAKLQASQAKLDDTEQSLLQQNRTASDPVELARRAAELKLVPAGPPVFVREVNGRYVISGTRTVVKDGVRSGTLLVVTPKAAPAPAQATR